MNKDLEKIERMDDNIVIKIYYFLYIIAHMIKTCSMQKYFNGINKIYIYMAVVN